MKSKDTLTVIGPDHKLLASQFTSQYEKATGAIREIAIFGAMMIHLRDVILSTRGQVRTGGAASKGTGVDAWIKQHCPAVSRPTALRFLNIAEGIRKEFKLSDSVDLQLLLTTPLEDLDEKLAKKRTAIEDFIQGKSQRQLLFTFATAAKKARGGARSSSSDNEEPSDPFTPEAEAHDLITEQLATFIGIWKKHWSNLPDKDFKEVDGYLKQMRDDVASTGKGLNRKA